MRFTEGMFPGSRFATKAFFLITTMTVHAVSYRPSEIIYPLRVLKHRIPTKRHHFAQIMITICLQKGYAKALKRFPWENKEQRRRFIWKVVLNQSWYPQLCYEIEFSRKQQMFLNNKRKNFSIDEGDCRGCREQTPCGTYVGRYIWSS